MSHPFDPANFGGEQIPRSPRRPRQRPAAAAKVRWKIKGAAEGPVYQGQRLVTPCRGCGSGRV